MSQAETQANPTQVTEEQKGPLDEAIAITQRRSIRNATADRLEVPHDKVCDLLRNVWSVTKGNPPLTDQEMFSGMSMIARFDLDPIAREVYVTRDNKGRLMTIVALDGWMKILDRTDHYDGFETLMKWEDEAETKIKSVTVTIHSTKRSHPAVYEAFEKEYAKLGGFMRGNIPWHMLRIFALRHAARLFTPLGGNVMLQEEADWINKGRPPAPDSGPTHAEQAEAIKAKREDEKLELEPCDETHLEASDPGTTQTNPESPMHLDEYQMLIEDVTSLGDVDEIEAQATEDTVLSESHRAIVLACCKGKRESIKASRGERSNGGESL